MQARSRLKQRPYSREEVLIAVLFFLNILIFFISIILTVYIAKNRTEEVINSAPPKPRVHFVEVAQAQEPTPEPVTIAKVTAYSCGGLTTEAEIKMNCPSLFSGEPKTADGTTPIPYKTMACDRANIGRVFELEGIGPVTCTDTGGAIQGSGRFDLYVTDVQEARQWGVQQLEYAEVL